MLLFDCLYLDILSFLFSNSWFFVIKWNLENCNRLLLYWYFRYPMTDISPTLNVSLKVFAARSMTHEKLAGDWLIQITPPSWKVTAFLRAALQPWRRTQSVELCKEFYLGCRWAAVEIITIFTVFFLPSVELNISYNVVFCRCSSWI